MSMSVQLPNSRDSKQPNENPPQRNVGITFRVGAIACAAISIVTIIFACYQLYMATLLLKSEINLQAAEFSAGLGLIGLNVAAHLWKGEWPNWQVSFSQNLGPVRIGLSPQPIVPSNLVPSNPKLLKLVVKN